MQKTYNWNEIKKKIPEKISVYIMFDMLASIIIEVQGNTSEHLRIELIDLKRKLGVNECQPRQNHPGQCLCWD